MVWKFRHREYQRYCIPRAENGNDLYFCDFEYETSDPNIAAMLRTIREVVEETIEEETVKVDRPVPGRPRK